MSRSVGKSFDADLRRYIGAYITLGTKGSVELKSNGTVSFSFGSEEVAVFAYKAEQLQKDKERSPS